MGTEDNKSKKTQFDEIVTRLTADYPSLNRPVRRRWPRSVLIAACVLGAILWGLLSVAMVAWGRTGVVLTCTVVALVAGAIALDDYRLRHR